MYACAELFLPEQGIAPRRCLYAQEKPTRILRKRRGKGHGGKDLKHPGRGVGGVTNTFCVFYTVRHWSRRQSTAGKAEKTKAWEQKRPSPRQHNTVTAGTFKRLLKTSRFLTAFFAERDGPAPISRPTRRVHRHAPHLFSAKRTFFPKKVPPRPPAGDLRTPDPPRAKRSGLLFRSGAAQCNPYVRRAENEWKSRGIRAE